MKIRPWTGALVMFALAGCQPNEGPPAPPVSTPDAPRPDADQADRAPATQDDEITFDGRDPFADPSAHSPGRQLTDLAGHRVTAIVTGTSVPRAVVVGPDGSARSVRVGDLLGPGVVERIESARVVVKRGFRTAEGRLVIQRDELPLHRS